MKTFQQEISIFTVDYSEIVLTLNRLNRPKKHSVILGINIFVLPDIDYFAVFTPCCRLHGNRDRASCRIGREN